ncbi:MAG: Crp/Fnr family transcriptional regulator [Acholeplasmatales bacterium]|nr:Crp/Fnr family transcriptional regulator [Acholeplasmatales bacterium]
MNLFDNLTIEEKEMLFDNVEPVIRKFHKGDTVFYEGDECDYIAYVNEGTIVAKQSFSDGHDNIIRIINQNEYIGINLMYSSTPKYKASFYADTEVTISLYSFNDLLMLMKASTVILKNFLRALSDSAISLSDHIKLLTHKTIRGKICYLLYNEYLKTGKLAFTIDTTKTDLAALLNIERPSLSFEMKKLQDEGIIDNKNKDYKILSLDKLMKEL